MLNNSIPREQQAGDTVYISTRLEFPFSRMYEHVLHLVTLRARLDIIVLKCTPTSTPSPFLRSLPITIMESLLVQIADLVLVQDQWKREPRTFNNTILSNFDLIQEAFFDFCSPASLLRLSRCCRSARTSVQMYMQRAFNINRILSRFFSSPSMFRRIQAKIDALIAGSSILQFFDRSFYPESDLDLYIHCGSDLDELIDFLSAEEYKYAPTSVQNANFTKAVERDMILQNYGGYYGPDDVLIGVYTFKKHTKGGVTHSVQLILTAVIPITVILGFHSSK